MTAPHNTDRFTLLGGRLRLVQMKDGARTGIDPVLLAASVPIEQGVLLDVGAGIGTAGLCCLTRCPQLHLVAVERESELSRLAAINMDANHMQGRMELICADWFDPSLRFGPNDCRPNGFDCVMTNPPFFQFSQGPASPDQIKAASRHQPEGYFARWFDLCIRRLKQGGVLITIIRAERLAELLAFLSHRCGAIELIPFWPRQDQAARLIVVRARKGRKTGLRIHPGLVLHPDKGQSGHYTMQAQSVLRDGAAIVPG